MPYIKPSDRDIDPRDQEINGVYVANNPGELNFQITCLLVAYLNSKKKSYKIINDILGALEGAKLEFYRRVAVPYEDKKIKENSDVY